LLGQAVRDRLHDGRYIGVCWVLAPLFAPVHQLLQNIVMQLAG